MSTSSRDAPTALVFTGLSAEEFLIFDRQTKRWLRRKCKGLTKWFWDGTPPEITGPRAGKKAMATANDPPSQPASKKLSLRASKKKTQPLKKAPKKSP